MCLREVSVTLWFLMSTMAVNASEPELAPGPQQFAQVAKSSNVLFGSVLLLFGVALRSSER